MQRANGSHSQASESGGVERVDISRADYAHVFHAHGKARVAYFDEEENFLGHQDITGMKKVELPLNL